VTEMERIRRSPGENRFAPLARLFCMEMIMNDQNTNRDDQSGDDLIDRRIMDEQADSRQDVLDAAVEASELDRQDPENPQQKKRAHDVEDPSHSRGSARRRS